MRIETTLGMVETGRGAFVWPSDNQFHPLFALMKWSYSFGDCFLSTAAIYFSSSYYCFFFFIWERML